MRLNGGQGARGLPDGLVASFAKTGDVTPKNVYEPPEIGCRAGGFPRPVRYSSSPEKIISLREGVRSLCAMC
jgi:hypothetical protein